MLDGWSPSNSNNENNKINKRHQHQSNISSNCFGCHISTNKQTCILIYIFANSSDSKFFFVLLAVLQELYHQSNNHVTGETTYAYTRTFEQKPKKYLYRQIQYIVNNTILLLLPYQILPIQVIVTTECRQTVLPYNSLRD